MNIMLAFEKSSAAMKFTDLIALLVFWICCSAPLVMLGAFIGIKKKKIKNPGKINTVPNQIPPKPWYLKTRHAVILAGVIPFAYILF
jgi:transmembrane 9 superfamily protein 2/4